MPEKEATAPATIIQQQPVAPAAVQPAAGASPNAQAQPVQG